MEVTINNQEVFMDKKGSTSVTGWTFFASTMMLVYAALLMIAGLAGIFNGDIAYRSDAGQLVIFDFATWGWIHLFLGVGMALAGGALILKQAWAPMGAVLLVMLAVLLNVLIVGAYPGWALLFILFDAILLLSLMVGNSKGEM
ncbi:MAG: hypothetical protein WAQ27_06385 [Candidatus Microsaccharimonas sp.]